MFGGNLKNLYLCIRFPKGTAQQEHIEKISYRQVVRRAYSIKSMSKGNTNRQLIL